MLWKIAVQDNSYFGNLSPVVTEEDLNNFFVFKTTSYLKKTCKVELSACPKKGNSKCCTYVTVLCHIYKEIIELNGIAFKSKPIKMDNAKVSQRQGHHNTNFWK